MPNIIKLKNSGTASSAPSSLELGELAINYADGKIYYKNSSNAIVNFNTGGSGTTSPASAPVVATTATYTNNAASSNPAVTLPTGIAAGDLLIMAYRAGNTTTATTPTGWSVLGSRNSTGVTYVWYKVADGNEGATQSVTMTADYMAAITYRITNWTGTPEISFAATDVNDPPSETASWGTDNNLFIAGLSNRRSDSTVTAAPAGYGTLLSIAPTSSTATSRSRVSTAVLTQTGATSDPAAFTTTGTIDTPHSFTIAVKGSPQRNAEIPVGGVTGQVLVKTSSSDYATEWAYSVSGITSTATTSPTTTTTLSASSERLQFFTGTNAHTVLLPVASTLVLGWQVVVRNNSTGVVTVQSSGGNTVLTHPAGVSATYTCILTSGTTAASWDGEYSSFNTLTGTGAMVLATSPTLTTPDIGAATGTSLNTTGAAGITTRQAATQDAVLIQGRAGGSNTRAVTITPTTLGANRTLTLPDVTGTVVTTGDSGTVTSTMIADGTIVNADINASAAINTTKITNWENDQIVISSQIFS